MHNSLKAMLPLVAGFAVLGCAPAPAPAKFSDADRTANLALTQSFRDRTMAKDWDGIGKLYAANAVMLPPNTPALRGPAAIKAFMIAFPPITAFTLVDDTLVGTGDRAYGIGRYRLTLGLKGAPVDSGKFLDVRERQADGSWLYVADMFSSDIPEPAAH
jgi:ketosteroid isomerase-like protein